MYTQQWKDNGSVQSGSTMAHYRILTFKPFYFYFYFLASSMFVLKALPVCAAKIPAREKVHANSLKFRIKPLVYYQIVFEVTILIHSSCFRLVSNSDGGKKLTVSYHIVGFLCVSPPNKPKEGRPICWKIHPCPNH